MIFIAGATGFVGKHLIEALREKGHPVRCLARSEKKAELCRSYGFEAVEGDITDRDSLRGALKGVKTVVHLIGIIQERRGVTFEKIHVEGTENLVDESKKAGAGHLFYQSALGASLNSPFKYTKTKAEAEEIIKASGIPYTVFRPSLIIGPGDRFTESIKELLGLGPVVPVPGNGESRFQPVYIEDWVRCLLKILDNPEALNRTFEFGGPEHLSYNEILKVMMEILGIRKSIVHLPLSLVKAVLPVSNLFGSLGRVLGINVPEVSAEQIGLLQVDNITGVDSVERLFGFKPLPFRDALSRFLK